MHMHDAKTLYSAAYLVGIAQSGNSMPTFALAGTFHQYITTLMSSMIWTDDGAVCPRGARPWDRPPNRYPRHRRLFEKGGSSNIILQPQPSSDRPSLRCPSSTLCTKELNCTFGQLNITLAVPLIFLGVGCVKLQPTAMKLGRRFENFNLLAGCAAASADSLVETATTDVFLQHERPAY